MPKSLLSFCLGATFDTLPSPSNLYRCHSQPSCYLCSKAVCTTAHILGACKVAVQQGRFTYHHDSVLQAFLSALETSLSSYSVSESLQHHRNFVIPGTKIIKSMKKPHTGLLYLAPDWRVMSDSNNKLDIQSLIVISQLRPDIFIFSKIQKTYLIIELTWYQENCLQDDCPPLPFCFFNLSSIRKKLCA